MDCQPDVALSVTTGIRSFFCSSLEICICKTHTVKTVFAFSLPSIQLKHQEILATWATVVKRTRSGCLIGSKNKGTTGQKDRGFKKQKYLLNSIE